MLLTLKKIVILCFSAAVLSGCGISNSSQAIAETPYVMFCETENTDEENLVSHVYGFTVDNTQAAEVAAFPYTANYPLGNYNRTHDKFLYVANDSTQNKIMQISKSTTNSTPLVEHVMDINSMFACGSKEFLLSQPDNHYCIQPAFLNFDSSSITYVPDFDTTDDLFAWAAAYDVPANKIYFTAYSDTQLHEQLGSTGLESIPPDTKLYCIDLKNETLSIVQSFQGENIMSISASNGKIFIVSSPYYNHPPINYSILEINSKERQTVDYPISCTNNAVMYDNIIYYVGEENHIRGVYAYDISKNDKELLYQQKDNAFINNISLNV